MKFREYSKLNDLARMESILTSKFKDLNFDIREKNGNFVIEWNWKENNGKVIPNNVEIMKSLREANIIPKRYNVMSNIAMLELEY